MEKLCPECCLSCPHRLDVYMALLNTLEQFFDLTPDEDDRVDALVIHGIAVELLKECGIVNQGYNLLASALLCGVRSDIVAKSQGPSLPQGSYCSSHYSHARRAQYPHINRGSLDPRRCQCVIKVFWQHYLVCQRQAHQSAVFACDE